VRFVIVGPADPGKADAIDAAGFAQADDDGVVFAGERTDMPECYAAMDLFLTASWREGFPRSAMEAAAMRLPTIATDIRGNRQVIDDGITGVLVPVRDPSGLAQGVRSLLARRDEWPTFAIACRARAHTHFDQQLVIDRTLATYRRH
jgi:glycosyltransferase involved in cell wall biosynthesis